VVDVANFLAGINVDPNGCHWSLLCDGSDRRRSRAKDSGTTLEVAVLRRYHRP
jgi:hypothetical protein